MNNLKSELKQLQQLVIREQKRGIHFIMASIVLWLGISVVRAIDIPILQQNMLTFCMSAPLMPLAYLMSKILGIKFSDKDNPLSALGIVLSVAQLPYLLIVMWIYRAVPDKMVMVYAMVFGAHLLPFGWYYKSKVYYVCSVIIPIMAMLIGCNFSALAVAVAMVVTEIIFCIALMLENYYFRNTDVKYMKREEIQCGSRNCTQEAERNQGNH